MNSPYTALATDQTLYVDNSGTGATLQVNFPAAPAAAKRITVKWWKSQSPAANGPTVSGNGNNVESWSASTGSNALAATTSITQLGGEATWEWAPTINGTAVNAWALVSS